MSYKIRKILINCLFILVLANLWGCFSTDKSDLENEMVWLYRVESDSVDLITSEVTGVTEFSAKVKNIHNKPIIIPFTFFHQLPVTQQYVCEIRNDSIYDVYEYGTSFIKSMGVDTLRPGETQKYFVHLLDDNSVRIMDPLMFVSFSYYFLEDFARFGFHGDFRKNVFFPLYKNHQGEIEILKPIPGFDPYSGKSYQLPARVLLDLKKDIGGYK